MEINTKKKPFLIKSENLENLRECFVKTSEIIKKAISENRFIIIKHHDDTDGYTAGFVIEKAILSVSKNPRQVARMASRSPYYDYTDALRDLNNCLGFNNSKPLVILCDLGSNEQSFNAIQRLLDYGFEFVIVDHHRYDNEIIDLTESFLNPHAYGIKTSLHAGALATELALFVNPLLSNINHLPAISGVADKSSGQDQENYVKLSGYSDDELKKWSFVIDHELYYLRSSGRAKFLADLFSMNEKNKIVINSLSKDVEKKFENVKKAAEKYVKITDYKKFKLLRIDKNKVSDWEYASSKTVRITHELINGPRITLAETKDMISYRADNVSFSGVDLLKELKQKFPYALISGGGHDVAGSIRFNEASRDEVMKYVLDYLTKIQ